MSHPRLRPPILSLQPLSSVLAIALLGTATAAATKEGKEADRPQRATVGQAAHGALVYRASPEQPWRILKPGGQIQNEDLIVAVPGGAIDAKKGAVRLSLLSDLARLSPYPVYESAVILHQTPGQDLDFTLDRGRVDITNRKKDGPARARIRFRDQTWEVILSGPGSRVALELYGRWPRGVPFSRDPKARETPAADLVFLVLEGSAELYTGEQNFAMHAPPGPAYFHWDSAGAADPAPQRMEVVPAWARPPATILPRVKDVMAVLKVIEQKLAARTSLEGALGEELQSQNPDARRIAVYGMGALDDLGGLTGALEDPKDEEVRRAAIVALRHWIGRKPGQDLKLYEFLTKEKRYSPNQAAIVLQLLHSFGDSDLARPATYEALIEYLVHDKIAIRQLAKFHLARLVPAGNADFDPAESKEDLEKVYAQWKQLIPTGQLPRRKVKR